MNISRRLWIGPLVFLLALSAVFTSFGDDMVMEIMQKADAIFR